MTCETRVTFTAVSAGQTAINVSMELVGTVSRSLGFAIAPAITRLRKDFSKTCGKECEAAAHGAAET